MHKYFPIVLTVLAWLLCPVTIAASSPTPAEINPSHSNGVSLEANISKPGVNITLRNAATVKLDKGQSLASELEFNCAAVTGDLTIQLVPSNGLNLVNTKTEWQFKAPLNKNITIPLELIATADGQQYIHIFATETLAHRTSSRALAMAIQVGDDRPQNTPSKTYISLPAKSRISDSK